MTAHLHPPHLPHQHRNRLDAIGASLSFACALHCALQPLLLALLPLMGLGLLLDERLETVFLGFSILLAGTSVISGWRHHRQGHALPLLALAILLIVSSRLPVFAAQEMPLAVSGALSIMTSHLLNLWLHKRFHLQHQLDELEPAASPAAIHSHIHSH